MESFRNGSMECICMHAGGGLITSQTTGSLIVQLKEGNISLWATGSSLPCISIFKPFWFTGVDEEFFTEQNREELIGYWKGIEGYHRMILDGRAAGLELYKSKRDKLEEELTKLAAEACTDAERTKVTECAISMEKSLLEELDSSEEDSSQRGKAGLYYRMYWKKQNKMLESKMLLTKCIREHGDL